MKNQTENFISQLILPMANHIIFHILNQNSEFWHKISSIECLPNVFHAWPDVVRPKINDIVGDANSYY